ncbi:MliC family protein [Oceanisphaera arctica]|uniref:C-type lysozyme inhibitor domain-containing protein n=1 Tax=Oceanisphaera arctica TaxID=641510 RepID=A0A2P5TJ45_9GAMM|nr:MliC family protein [Oceanisphaera arctica]PPL14928.1 hypothetical protein UN63_14225 [Oceanisphaera arctica]GHA22799.1 hypothetical protein GCM10007082_24410 [Oceanisphaera arctica]
MKIFTPLMFASILLLSACASSPQEKMDGQANMAAPSTFPEHQYRCESGETMRVNYPSTDSARVQYQGREYTMKIAVSASGARYLGSELEWWTKGTGPGSEGSLLRHLADSTSGNIIELCTGI